MARDRELLYKLHDILDKHEEPFKELPEVKLLIELERVYHGAELLERQQTVRLQYTSNGYALDREDRVIGLQLSGIHISETYSFLKKFPHLKWLSLANTKITNIACLEALPKLRYLDLHGNYISDISVLATLPRLNQLDLSENYLTDISPLKGLKRLIRLDVSCTPFSGRNITDLSALEGLISLTELYARWNCILDISALKHVSNLTVLDLSANRLSDISVLANLPHLTHLDVSGSPILGGKITDISALKTLKGLQTLYARCNHITNITPLQKATALTTLDLSFNEISDISGLNLLSKLRHLDLSSNQISDISAIAPLSELHELHLSSNRISDITALAALPKLRTLQICSNDIKNISALSVLPELEQVDLSSNSIIDISVMKALPQLTELDLSQNYITDIAALKALHQLTTLDLSSNHLFDISVLHTLSHLQDLWLAKNHIANIDALKELSHLVHLDLSDNDISSITSLKGIQHITSLNLSGNRISDISALHTLTELTEIRVNHNLIADISALQALTRLTYFSAAGNHISNMSVLGLLSNLAHVNLRGNEIQRLSNDVFVLKQLRHLDVRQNRLNTLPKTILKATINIIKTQGWKDEWQDGILVADNLFKHPLDEILSQDTNAVQRYFASLSTHKYTIEAPRQQQPEKSKSMRQANISHKPNPAGRFSTTPSGTRQKQHLTKKGGLLGSPENPSPTLPKGEGVSPLLRRGAGGEVIEPNSPRKQKGGRLQIVKKSQPLHEVKVILLGEGGAGKTSLVKRIFKQAFNQSEPLTHGINITNGKFRSGSTNMHVHFWDFGGQEILHATHQFFLSKRCMYVLVLDGRKDEKMDYWLEYIKQFGEQASVLVVLNKIDQHPSFDVNRTVLQKTYPNIHGFYRTSCATNDGIKTVTKHLFNALKHTELFQATWPCNWFNVKHRVEKMTQNSINYDDYIAICEDEIITDPAEQETLLEALHDLGVILYFKDFALQDMQVLNPEWVTNAVYRILDSQDVAESQGVLRLSLLNRILRNHPASPYHYSRHHYKFIIDVMKKFELCYELGTTAERVLIPDLLPVSQPEAVFEYPTSLKFLLGYDFLPRSILPRFLARRHTDVKTHLCWRTGVILEDDTLGATAIVKVEYDLKKILIYVNGERKRDYFTILRKTFQEIHAEYSHLRIDERIGLPDAPSVTISLEHLLRLERMGQETYIPEGASKPYSVRVLLGTFAGEYAHEDEQLSILKELRTKTDLIEQITGSLSDELQTSLNVIAQDSKKRSVFKHFLSK